MDVILDANVYLSDIRMESIRFKNLFDYLRRTKSSLVIPRLVREETVGKYGRMLEAQTQRTEQAIQNLNRLIVNPNSRVHFNAPNPKRATRELRQKLRAPAKRIAVRYYPEVDGVDVSEVFMRGIDRRRPANSEGEELRDVILWLIVLQYADRGHKDVAFITSDGAFWNGEDAHVDIRQDIAKRGVKVELFRNIEDFVRSRAPAPTPIDEPSVSSFFDVRSQSDAIVAVTKEALPARRGWFATPQTVRSASLLEARLAEGTLYEIDSETKLAELSYATTVIVEVESYPLAPGQEIVPGGPFAALSGGLHGSFTPQEPARWGSRWAAFSGEGHRGFFATPLEKADFGLLAGLSGSVHPATPIQSIIETYAVHGKGYFSVRVVGGVASEIELDRIEVLGVQEVQEAVPAAKHT